MVYLSTEILFAEVPSAKSGVLKCVGLFRYEWRDLLKMTGMLATVGSPPGCSTNMGHCKHHIEMGTLPHVLGSCPQGGTIAKKIRHNTIRPMIANLLRKKASRYGISRDTLCS